MSKRVDASERSEWVRRWRASGLSCAQFAARHGLSKATLYAWSYQAVRSPGSSSRASGAVAALARVSAPRSSRARFTQVRVVGSSSVSRSSVASACVIEVELGGGRVVRVLGAVDESSLRSVLRVVSEC